MSGLTNRLNFPHYALTWLSPNRFSLGYKYSQSTHSFRYYNDPFHYDTHHLLGSARLPVTTVISCQYLTSCLASGSRGPTVWVYEYVLGWWISTLYIPFVTKLRNWFVKMQSVTVVCIIGNCRILPHRNIKCNFTWLTAAVVENRQEVNISKTH